MTRVIDRTSSVPYDEQLSDILEDRIVSGEFPVDERLPSELELCRDFGAGARDRTSDDVEAGGRRIRPAGAQTGGVRARA